jgi:hypothetical protein
MRIWQGMEKYRLEVQYEGKWHVLSNYSGLTKTKADWYLKLCDMMPEDNQGRKRVRCVPDD